MLLFEDKKYIALMAWHLSQADSGMLLGMIDNPGYDFLHKKSLVSGSDVTIDKSIIIGPMNWTVIS